MEVNLQRHQLNVSISPCTCPLERVYQLPGWSISLFHYRNHGHDFGRVLVGLLVSDAERAAFDAFLDNLGYVHYEETSNSAFTQFLQ